MPSPERAATAGQQVSLLFGLRRAFNTQLTLVAPGIQSALERKHNGNAGNLEYETALCCDLGLIEELLAIHALQRRGQHSSWPVSHR